MQALLVSTGIVALAEIGDKTQLLSFVLAARYRTPLPIVMGILVATLLNHAFAGALGTWIITMSPPGTLRWLLATSFVAMAVWSMIPDKVDADETRDRSTRWGIFGATTIAFFIAEMGDKTQIATVALAARFGEYLAVVTGTTLGMMLANVPAVLIGDRIADRMPMRAIRMVVATIFALLALMVMFGDVPNQN